VIRASDIDRVLHSPGRDVEPITEWCRRNGVDESAMGLLKMVYGFSKVTAAIAVDAFRLGHDARRGDEPKSAASFVGGGQRYAVESVVVDRANGRIVGSPTSVQSEAEGLAGTYNELDADTRRAERKA